MTAIADWRGGHVRDTLEIRVATIPERSIMTVEELVGIAVRRNPRRAHLLVSTVLAKHIPTHPGIALAAAELLGLLVSDVFTDAASPAASFGARLSALLPRFTERPDRADAAPSVALRELAALRDDIRAATVQRPLVVTLGFAETATGLGQVVADALGSYYLHSTRHAVPSATPFAGFEEEHSHATDHGLLPSNPHWLLPGGTVVLVDDELSTGTTAINTVSAIHALIPQAHWVIASLIDLRSPFDLDRFGALADKLGTRISVVSLAAGAIDLPADVLDRAATMIDSLPTAESVTDSRGTHRFLDCTDLGPVRSARFGTTEPVDAELAGAIARRVLPAINGSDRGTLVLGSEEFIALPMTTADALAELTSAVRFSTSTRSPIVALDRADYPIAGGVTFTSHDSTTDGPGKRFAYNLTTAGSRFGTIVYMPEPGTDSASLLGPGGAVEALQKISPQLIVVLLAASAPTDGTPS